MCITIPILFPSQPRKVAEFNLLKDTILVKMDTREASFHSCESAGLNQGIKYLLDLFFVFGGNGVEFESHRDMSRSPYHGAGNGDACILTFAFLIILVMAYLTASMLC